ncbi:hypothetical protein HHI36_021181 [Cryptolaemus montrouzieri]|uniref:Uncharacterized protein n=1 Tax=Cryptolaemus montrouzieri TaxID=559131 RepID=A0ABD2MWV9_9CUCU
MPEIKNLTGPYNNVRVPSMNWKEFDCRVTICLFDGKSMVRCDLNGGSTWVRMDVLDNYSTPVQRTFSRIMILRIIELTTAPSSPSGIFSLIKNFRSASKLSKRTKAIRNSNYSPYLRRNFHGDRGAAGERGRRITRDRFSPPEIKGSKESLPFKLCEKLIFYWRLLLSTVETAAGRSPSPAALLNADFEGTED